MDTPKNEEVTEKSNTGWVVAVLIILLVIGIFLLNRGPKAKVSDSDVATTTEESDLGTSTLKVSDTKSAMVSNKGGVAINSGGVSASMPSQTKVKIALLQNPGSVTAGMKLNGCDAVVMKDIALPKTTSPLNASLRALFADTTTWPPANASTSGNFISSQSKLSFDKATLEKGVAKIYLLGLPTLNGVCDDARIGTQIEMTAKQFPTVKSVETYLNGVKTSMYFSEK